MSTPPLHAEVREKIDAIFLRKYNDLHDNFFESEFEAAKAAAAEVLQAVADALLAGLPPKKHRVTDNIGNAQIDSYNAGHNNCLDAVTRVIGELGGRRT